MAHLYIGSDSVKRGTLILLEITLKVLYLAYIYYNSRNIRRLPRFVWYFAIAGSSARSTCRRVFPFRNGEFRVPFACHNFKRKLYRRKKGVSCTRARMLVSSDNLDADYNEIIDIPPGCAVSYVISYVISCPFNSDSPSGFY